MQITAVILFTGNIGDSATYASLSSPLTITEDPTKIVVTKSGGTDTLTLMNIAGSTGSDSFFGNAVNGITFTGNSSDIANYNGLALPLTITEIVNGLTVALTSNLGLVDTLNHVYTFTGGTGTNSFIGTDNGSYSFTGNIGDTATYASLTSNLIFTENPTKIFVTKSGGTDTLSLMNIVGSALQDSFFGNAVNGITFTGNSGDIANYNGLALPLTITEIVNGLTVALTSNLGLVDTLNHVYTFTGGTGTNSFIGANNGSYSFTGNTGDTAYYNNLSSPLTITEDPTKIVVTKNGGTDTLSLMNVVGSALQDSFFGNAVNGITFTGNSSDIANYNGLALPLTITEIVNGLTVALTSNLGLVDTLNHVYTFTGGTGTNSFIGADNGSYSFTGNIGDSATYASLSSNLTFTENPTSISVTKGGGTDTLTLMNIAGGTGSDSFIGKAINGIIFTGNSTGNNSDSAFYNNLSSALTISEVATGLTVAFTSNLNLYDNLQKVYNITGSTGTNTFVVSNSGSYNLTGNHSDIINYSGITTSILTFTENSSNVTVTKGLGTDVVMGLGTFIGGSDSNAFVGNTVTGITFNDVSNYSASYQGVSSNLTISTITNGFTIALTSNLSIFDTLNNINSITGGSGSDIFTSTTVSGITFNGNASLNDTAKYNLSSNLTISEVATNKLTVTSGSFTDTLNNVTSITAGSGTNSFNGIATGSYFYYGNSQDLVTYSTVASNLTFTIGPTSTTVVKGSGIQDVIQNVAANGIGPLNYTAGPGASSSPSNDFIIKTTANNLVLNGGTGGTGQINILDMSNISVATNLLLSISGGVQTDKVTMTGGHTITFSKIPDVIGGSSTNTFTVSGGNVGSFTLDGGAGDNNTLAFISITPTINPQITLNDSGINDLTIIGAGIFTVNDFNKFNMPTLGTHQSYSVKGSDNGSYIFTGGGSNSINYSNTTVSLNFNVAFGPSIDTIGVTKNGGSNNDTFQSVTSITGGQGNTTFTVNYYAISQTVDLFAATGNANNTTVDLSNLSVNVDYLLDSGGQLEFNGNQYLMYSSAANYKPSTGQNLLSGSYNILYGWLDTSLTGGIFNTANYQTLPSGDYIVLSPGNIINKYTSGGTLIGTDTITSIGTIIGTTNGSDIFNVASSGSYQSSMSIQGGGGNAEITGSGPTATLNLLTDILTVTDSSNNNYVYTLSNIFNFELTMNSFIVQGILSGNYTIGSSNVELNYSSLTNSITVTPGSGGTYTVVKTGGGTDTVQGLTEILLGSTGNNNITLSDTNTLINYSNANVNLLFTISPNGSNTTTTVEKNGSLSTEDTINIPTSALTSHYFTLEGTNGTSVTNDFIFSDGTTGDYAIVGNLTGANDTLDLHNLHTGVTSISGTLSANGTIGTITVAGSNAMSIQTTYLENYWGSSTNDTITGAFHTVYGSMGNDTFTTTAAGTTMDYLTMPSNGYFQLYPSGSSIAMEFIVGGSTVANDSLTTSGSGTFTNLIGTPNGYDIFYLYDANTSANPLPNGITLETGGGHSLINSITTTAVLNDGGIDTIIYNSTLSNAQNYNLPTYDYTFHGTGTFSALNETYHLVNPTEFEVAGSISVTGAPTGSIEVDDFTSGGYYYLDYSQLSSGVTLTIPTGSFQNEFSVTKPGGYIDYYNTSTGGDGAANLYSFTGGEGNDTININSSSQIAPSIFYASNGIDSYNINIAYSSASTPLNFIYQPPSSDTNTNITSIQVTANNTTSSNPIVVEKNNNISSEDGIYMQSNSYALIVGPSQTQGTNPNQYQQSSNTFTDYTNFAGTFNGYDGGGSTFNESQGSLATRNQLIIADNVNNASINIGSGNNIFDIQLITFATSNYIMGGTPGGHTLVFTGNGDSAELIATGPSSHNSSVTAPTDPIMVVQGDTVAGHLDTVSLPSVTPYTKVATNVQGPYGNDGFLYDQYSLTLTGGHTAQIFIEHGLNVITHA